MRAMVGDTQQRARRLALDIIGPDALENPEDDDWVYFYLRSYSTTIAAGTSQISATSSASACSGCRVKEFDFMDLLPSSDQEAILDTLRNFLADRAPPDRLREHGAIGNPDAALWPELGELGLIGIGLPEAQGGVGLGAAEEMLAFREFGRHLISPEIFALMLAARLRDPELRAAIVAGTARIGLANRRGADGYHLFEAVRADHILLIEDEQVTLLPAAAFGDRMAVNSTDAVLSLERATWPVQPRRCAATRPWRSGRGCCSAPMRSACRKGRANMGIEYAKVREQFGKADR